MVQCFQPLGVVLSLILSQVICGSHLDFRYHNYNSTVDFLKNFTNTFPDITSLYSIGKSVQGRELYAVLIRANKCGVAIPRVKLIGNIHGNEPVGKEVLLHFIEYVVTQYNKNDQVTQLLKNTHLHILPSMNPDGFEVAGEGLCSGVQGRENANKTDLNRNFPDYFIEHNTKPQPETEAVKEWMKNIPFILSASLHGGALVANYPFENSQRDFWELASRWFNKTEDLEQHPWRFENASAYSAESLSPDDDVFQHLAKLYANKHRIMHRGDACPGTAGNLNRFEGGITNGAAWYKITGGMQDYNYAFHGCMELTLELSCCKYPRSQKLKEFWEDNKDALLHYVQEANRGVKGIIIDAVTKKPIANATLQIEGRNINFYSSKDGEFWRILLSGIYDLKITAPGYQPKKVEFTVKESEFNPPSATELHISLNLLNASTTSAATDGSTSSIFSNTTATSANIIKPILELKPVDNYMDVANNDIAFAVTSNSSTSNLVSPIGAFLLYVIVISSLTKF